MTLFKLFFEHDMVLEPVSGTPRKGEPSRLEDFLKPQQTYSRFYFTATDLEKQRFGLSASDHFGPVMQAIEQGLSAGGFILPDGSRAEGLMQALDALPVSGAAVVLTGTEVETDQEAGAGIRPFENIPPNESFRDHIGRLTGILDTGNLVLFKVEAHHGYDLHLFARDNLYRSFFYPLKALLGDGFRFFSINGKRAKSERLFYFETWSLDRPPHGFEEVFDDTAYY